MRQTAARGERSAGPEIRISGRAVSRGSAVGRTVCLYGQARQFYRRTIRPTAIEAEILRFEAAVNAAGSQLQQITRNARGNPAKSAVEILETHLAILQDESLAEKVKKKIEIDRVNSEWAAKVVIDEFIAEFKGFADEDMRERYIDIEDVGERIQSALGGTALPYAALRKRSVIISRELRPSTLVELAACMPAAIITENGGWTSHTFIIARELNLPAVTGVKNLLGRLRDGDRVFVNGFVGDIIINPTAETRRKHFAKSKTGKPPQRQTGSPGPAKTLDGRQIHIQANADSPAAYSRGRAFGAAGVGLFRSEYLFTRSKGFPTEQEQIAAYSAIAAAAGDEGVKIRTFDLNSDEISTDRTLHEANPALGLRAIRMSLAEPNQIRAQIRSLLIASHGRKIDILIPMVSGVAEIRTVAEIIRKEKRRLGAKKIPFGSPRLGAMIEVPSAVLTVKQILEVVDFISLGTNDLVQYLLAVDRDNEAVAEWFSSLHPGVLQAIQSVISAASAAKKELIVCGEMAGSPYYIPILIGLGARQLSMNINSIAGIRALICNIAYEEARAIAARCVACATADEAEQMLRRGITEKWGPLFPEHFGLAALG